MLFNKKNKKIKPRLKDSGVSDTKVVVHTMPQRILKKGVVSVNHGSWNFLIFFIIFLLIGGGAFFVFKDYLFSLGNSSGNHKINPINTPINNNINGLSNVNNNLNSNSSNINLNDNTNTLSNINKNRNRNRNINISNNENINENTNSSNNLNNYIQTISPASDRDRDTMPDIEEALYGTKPGISDTDKDGFLDGQELANAYNPLNTGSNKLEDSGLIKIYNNPTYRYSVFYPASWKVIPLGGSDQEMTFVSDNKEFIEIAVMDNPDALTAVDWYLNQIPSEFSNKAERIWANNFMGIKSLDGLNVYLTPISADKNFIYQISYMVGSHTHISFPITFQMMVRTFDLRR